MTILWINPEQVNEQTGPSYQRIAKAYIEQIKTSTLTQKNQLPPQRQLADRLGVTVGTVSRAYKRLEDQGYVYGHVGRGTFVRQQQPDNGFQIPQHVATNRIDLSLGIAPLTEQPLLLSQTLKQLSQQPESLALLMGYYSEQGMPHQREIIANWLQQFNLITSADRLLLTNGGQHGVNIVIASLCKPGDTVLCEQLNYPGFIASARQHRLQLLGVQLDEKGIMPDHFEALCQKYQPRAIYLNPTLHNPTTHTTPTERRQQIIDIANQYNTWIIEDDVQGILQQSRPPALYNYAPERVFYIGSFSKLLAGGLRSGWIISPKSTLPLLARSLRANCWLTPPITHEIACRWLQDGSANKLIQLQLSTLTRRHQIAENILSSFNPISHPQSYHIWLPLPPIWQAQELHNALAQENIDITPSASFAVGNAPIPQAIRISISHIIEDNQLIQALQKISERLKSIPPEPEDW
ncbi:PLP-dependent aminotransferase family protein [Zooshikella sp. RANM57]|uniref:aminotransferase-like domain-containing protein n=1 Tax=Zooshikella sp. RANM57 TaxID=3425863 RepID=UPI003D6ECA60